jgi:predicted GH43/DUF377 family glycosyl hydrolase
MMISFITIFLFPLIALSCLHTTIYGENTLQDLSAFSDDFIIENRKIDIPGYPDAFNPSIVEYGDGYLMSFRHFTLEEEKKVSYIGLMRLNKDFSPKGTPVLLNTRTKHPAVPSRSEDARIFYVDGRLYVVYNDDVSPKNNTPRKMYYAEILETDESFICTAPLRLSSNAGPLHRDEKNWIPFDFDGQLYFSYSINPHKILYPTNQTNHYSARYSTHGDIEWNWGELRGGTPAVLFEDSYVAFFHSMNYIKSIYSDDEEKYHYYMGAYLFEPEPPFNVTHMSATPILGMGLFESDKPREKVVVFPGGFVADDHYFWVVYGKDDSECWVVKLDKFQLINTLVSVNTRKVSVHVESREY